jgi:hypothetical protein
MKLIIVTLAFFVTFVVASQSTIKTFADAPKNIPNSFKIQSAPGHAADLQQTNPTNSQYAILTSLVPFLYAGYPIGSYCIILGTTRSSFALVGRKIYQYTECWNSKYSGYSVDVSDTYTAYEMNSPELSAYTAVHVAIGTANCAVNGLTIFNNLSTTACIASNTSGSARNYARGSYAPALAGASQVVASFVVVLICALVAIF